METFRASFFDGLTEAAGRAAGGLIVWIALAVFVVIFALVLYVLMRGRWPGIGVTVNFEVPPDQPAAGASQASATAPPPERKSELPRLHPPADEPGDSRRSFLRTLDSIEKVVAKFYLLLMYVVLFAVTAAMGWVILAYPDDGYRDFMLFYCGVIYFVGALTILVQIVSTRQRLAETPQAGLMDQLRSKFQAHVESSPQVHRVDAAALEAARRHLASGGSLDEACELIHPGYGQMPGWSKKAFRRVVEMALRDGA